MKNPLTIKDIARLANVSQSTVSKALNNRHDVSPKTKERILEIVSQHNFIPDASGKALKNRYTNNIGVIFRKDDNPLRNPFFSRVLEGIEAEIAFNEYNLILYLMPDHKKPGLPKMVQQRQVDGIILVGTQSPDFVDTLREAGIPTVLIDPRAHIPSRPQVLIDNENGAFLATRHLIEHGHRKIGFIAGELSIPSFQQRLDGYKKALTYYGIPITKSLIKCGGYEEGYRFTRDLLQDAVNRPTAIFAAYDINAIHGYRAIYEANLRIPDDISFVGFDDIDLARMASPPLTTIRVYKEELGSVAVRNLRSILLGETPPSTTSIIPVKLVERDSVRSVEVQQESAPARQASAKKI
ncbi:MAG TPA: LacI family DNA-binding transcriptional regulator [Calditrichia bacterium]|nr:LacI family DNA-binding transcriptional regulator [Calditrichota bacterium]HQU70640.1 LacI family DNA-binding transcriptional regulator [Calditrichia bacterium]HQV33208.1 LacI family DNA-binding transcriptional regulator [Calditrichia bacterium]